MSPEQRGDLRHFILDQLGASPRTFSDIVASATEAGYDAVGDHVLEIRHNLLICCGMNADFVDTLLVLKNDGAVQIQHVDLLTYLVCSLTMPTIPVANVVKAYAAPHWLPCLLSLTRQNP